MRANEFTVEGAVTDFMRGAGMNTGGLEKQVDSAGFRKKLAKRFKEAGAETEEQKAAVLADLIKQTLGKKGAPGAAQTPDAYDEPEVDLPRDADLLVPPSNNTRVYANKFGEWSEWMQTGAGYQFVRDITSEKNINRLERYQQTEKIRMIPVTFKDLGDNIFKITKVRGV